MTELIIRKGRLKAIITIEGSHKCVGYDARKNLLPLHIPEQPVVTTRIIGMEPGR